MTEKKNIDLLGIGNAITDILVKVDYNFLEKMKLNIGAMQLTDYETINKTINLFKVQLILKNLEHYQIQNMVLAFQWLDLVMF